MGHAFQIKQHDRRPVLAAFLELEHNGEAIASLANASKINFHLRATGAATYLVTGQATLVNATAGEVEYHWGSGETATAGVFSGEFEIVWNGSVLQTVPGAGYLPVRVVDDVA